MMFNKKNILIITVILGAYANVQLNAIEVNRDKYISDTDYVEGMLYLKGKKGLTSVIKQISNCPYAKCRKSDLNSNNFLSTIDLKVDKPNFKIAIRKLHKSVKNDNFLAADKLTEFLIKNLNYKSSVPNSYLLKLLKRDLGINHNQYKEMLIDSLKVGSSSKGCVTSYIYSKVLDNGYLEQKIDKNISKQLMIKASNNCPVDNYYKLLADTEFNSLNR